MRRLRGKNCFQRFAVFQTVFTPMLLEGEEGKAGGTGIGG